MRIQFKFLSEKYQFIKNQNLITDKTVIADDIDHLKYLVRKEIRLRGNQCDLNYIDVSQITDMTGLFERLDFNGNISKWNVSNVENMSNIFSNSQFNGDISNWDVSNVKYMANFFKNSSFSGDISNWNVSNVEDMSGMFFGSEFNGNISKWDVYNVENMTDMFCVSKFNGNISKWDVSNVLKMRQIFYDSEFNNDLSDWRPYKLNMLFKMFDGAKCLIPYWFNYSDHEIRKKAIDSYHLQKDLDNELNKNDIKETKMKI